MRTVDRNLHPHALADAELDAISGGKDDIAAVKAEAQLMQTLSSMINDVMKNFGAALQTAARGG